MIKPTSRTHSVCIVAACALSVVGCRMQASTDSEAPIGRPPVAVDVAAARPSTVTDAVEVVGSLAPKFVADVKSEVSGTVTEVYVTDWVSVRKQTPLARLDTSETDAAIAALKAGEAQARVFEARAVRERDRAVQLRQFGLITDQTLDEATTAVEAAAAATEAARAQIRTAEARLAKSFIKSPMDGVVAERRVSVGDRVENMGGGDPMFRIVDNRVLDLTVTVPSAKLAAVRVGQTVTFAADLIAGRTFTGTVTFVNPSVDEPTRSGRVIATVPNVNGALRGGLFVRGRIVISSRDNVLQVPREALRDWNIAARTAQVFVVVDGHAQPRNVHTGAIGDAGVEIVDGISSGDSIVTRGAFALRPGDAASVSPAKAGA